MKPLSKVVLLAALSFVPVLGGCKHKAASTAPAGPTESYTVRGEVISTDAKTGEVTLDHEAIPGFMEAMTMPYKLADRNVISELHPGDRISARLQVEKDSEGEYHHARLDQIVILAQARPDYKPTTQYNVPTAGQPVPEFALVNQNGKTIHLKDYRGKALLITFIYTRCPLADFCPKMSRNFAEINAALEKDPKAYAATHLLSISFDPAYDTPAVLKSYGGAYTGKYTKEKFEHWEFAAPKKDALEEMEHFFNVGVTPGDSSTLNHSLSTLLIDKDGRIAAWYPGADWKPSEVLDAMRRAG
ncbi:MAG: SCO family protein [Acidobacteria bacterium]|nr:SCO family protein [Acidobacteriota bacterium]